MIYQPPVLHRGWANDAGPKDGGGRGAVWVPLIELWGMTELGGLGTTFASNGPVKHGSIGVALHVDARMASTEDATVTLPAGEIGELMIKGGVVMQGYYKTSRPLGRPLKQTAGCIQAMSPRWMRTAVFLL